MAYELWDTVTRNIVGTFAMEAEALDAARQLIVLNAHTYPGALALVFEDASGDTTFLGSGDELTMLCEPCAPPT